MGDMSDILTNNTARYLWDKSQRIRGELRDWPVSDRHSEAFYATLRELKVVDDTLEAVLPPYRYYFCRMALGPRDRYTITEGDFR